MLALSALLCTASPVAIFSWLALAHHVGPSLIILADAYMLIATLAGIRGWTAVRHGKALRDHLRHLEDENRLLRNTVEAGTTTEGGFVGQFAGGPDEVRRAVDRLVANHPGATAYVVMFAGDQPEGGGLRG